MSKVTPFDKYKGMTKEQMAKKARRPASVSELVEGVMEGTAPSVAVKPILRKK